MINARIPNVIDAAMTHVQVTCAQISQGASPRLRVATVSLQALDALVKETGPSFASKYGGQGSRAWSPPD